MQWETAARLDRLTGMQAQPDWAARIWRHPSARLLPVTGSGHLGFATPGTVASTPTPEDGFCPATDIFLAEAAGQPLFARLVPDDDAVRAALAPLEPYAVGGLRPALDGLDDGVDTAFLAIALAQWHATAGFCPACGQPTVPVQAGNARRCQACQRLHFPRVDPAVIVAVFDQADRLLLGRQPVWAPQRLSIFAGFVEAGESAEQALHRELAEELGLSGLDQVEYAGSQPWPFPRSLMLAYTARVADDAFQIDHDEIEYARWFTRAELAAAVAGGEVTLPARHSIARRLIDAWSARG